MLAASPTDPVTAGTPTATCREVMYASRTIEYELYSQPQLPDKLGQLPTSPTSTCAAQQNLRVRL